MKIHSIIIAGLLSVSVSTANTAYADESAADACEEAARILRESDDLVAALDEASWCVDGIKELQANRILHILPDSVDGYVAGEAQKQNALGMTTISRLYTKDKESIKVAMTQGGIAGTGLAALAQLGLQFGGESVNKFRVERRTVFQMTEQGDQMFTVKLRSGGLMYVGSDSLDAPTVKQFLEQLPISTIDDSLAQ